MKTQHKWEQVRPEWCPYPECGFKRRAVDSICVGELPEPAPHDGDFNTHRMCLTDLAEGEPIIKLMINKSDVSWFRWMFDEIFPIKKLRVQK